MAQTPSGSQEQPQSPTRRARRRREPMTWGARVVIALHFLVVLLFLALFAWLRVRFPMAGKREKS